MKLPVSLDTSNRRRRTPVLVAVLALLATVVLGPALLGATAGRAAAATALATLSISSLDPVVATPGAELNVTGTVRSGTERLRDVRVALRLSRTRVNSRSELSGVASGLTTGKDGDVITSSPVPGGLAADRSASFALSADIDKLEGLGEFGVYVLAIEVTATHSGGSGRVAITRTFLPWVPKTPDFQPTGFAWLWPLVAHPTKLGDGTYADDSLARDLGGGGRLSRLAETGEALGQQVPLTWMVDPDLLDTARDMSNGYTVLGSSNTVLGGGSELAGQWLETLRAATATSEVVALPYGDPDVNALQRGDLASDVVRAHDTGAQEAANILGRPVTSDIGWPTNGFVDRETLGLLRRSGMETVVLDGRAQPTRLELNYTPSGRSQARSPSGPVTTLLSDPGLTGLLARADKAPLLAAQRFLAETAMITSELPNAGSGRVILIAPPRRWDPPPEFLDRLVRGTASASWMSGTSLSAMSSAPPAEVERRPVHYPASQRRGELPAPYLTALRSQHDSIAVFSGVLTDPDALVTDLDKAVLRLESSWWRGREIRVNRLSAERTHVADQLALIHVQPGSYTFGSKSGTIPVTISNGLDQDVVVALRLEQGAPRLRLEPLDPITIGANRKVQVSIKATAVANGVVDLRATLHTPSGTALSPQPVQLRIRITEYGTVALFITIGAAGVLVLAALVRLGRRALAARRDPSDQPPEADDATRRTDDDADAPGARSTAETSP